MAMKGIGGLGIFVIALLLIGVLFVGASQTGFLPAPVTGGIITTITPAAPGEPSAVQCPQDLKTSLQTRTINTQNSTLDYAVPSHTVAYTIDGKFQGSATVSSATGAFSVIDASVRCGETVDLFSINSANSSAVSIKGVVLSGPTAKAEFNVDRQSSIVFSVLDDTNNNLTTPSGFAIDPTSSAQVFGTGTTNQYIMRIRPDIAQTSWGSSEVQNIICGDFNTAKYARGSVTVAGPGVTELATLPTFCVSDGSGDKAWSITPVARSEGFRTLTITITSDLGDPASGDDVVFKFYEGSYYQANDGTIKGGISSDNLAAIGVTDTSFTFDVT